MSDAADANQRIRHILERAMPDTCDAVGPSNVSDVVNGKTDFTRPAAGAQFSLLELLKDLTAAAVLARAVVDLVKSVRARQNRPLTKDELRKALESVNLPDPRLDADEADRVIDAASAGGSDDDVSDGTPEAP